MPLSRIRAALETAVMLITPPIDTVFENTAYQPTTGRPFQQVNLIMAEPDNQEFGSNYQEQGYMQLTLFYPQQGGPSASDSRVELIRSRFSRGQSFTNGGYIVTINRTPRVSPAYIDGGRFIRPVSITFYSNIGL